MSDDKIAQALNMRSLQEINDEKQELLDEVNPDKLPDLPVNAFSTNEEVENLPIEAPVQHPVVIDDAGAEENLKDIELAKANIENIISLGDDSVKEMVEIAKQSESPRAFEVVSTLMKTLLDANKDYVEMSTKKRYAKEEANPAKNEVTNNNLIVSTADLLKMIKDSSE
jgi:hypothetical protein|tara:strand:- start:5516 stop:6022 length:507 start_codon:yes stop_codon:yes gene_type:complete